MSMIFCLQTLEQGQLEAIMADAIYVNYYLDGNLSNSGLVGGLLGKLFGRKKDSPRRKEDFPEWAPLDDSKGACLDKAWHGIHFLLTGTDWSGEWPLNFIVEGGAEIGDDYAGYGPARGFGKDQVKEIAGALEQLREDELKRRFDPTRMMELEIYPTIWDRDPAEDDTLGYCLEFYGELKKSFAGAASEGKAMIVYLT